MSRIYFKKEISQVSFVFRTIAPFFDRSSCKKLSLLISLSMLLLKLLDALFFSILLPYMLWLWVSENSRAKIVIKAVMEVCLRF